MLGDKSFRPLGKHLGRSPHRSQLAQKSRFPHNSETGRKAPPPPTRGVQTGPAREGPAPSGRSTRSARRHEDCFPVDAPRGGTRAQASRVPPPPSDAEPPPSSPTRAASLASAAAAARKSAAHVFPHPSTRRREMRFHRVIILTMPRLRVRQGKKRRNGRDTLRFQCVIILSEAITCLSRFPIPCLSRCTFPCEARGVGV